MSRRSGGAPGQDGRPAEARDRRLKRRRGFLNHLIAYFAVMVVLVPVNAMVTPATPWFLLPMVLWGAPLAVHAAWTMELFGIKGRENQNR